MVSEAVRVIHVGAGDMGRWWLQVEAASPDVEVVGIVDLDLATAERNAVDAGLGDVPRARDLDGLPTRSSAQAVINVTVPKAHHPVNTAALRGGLDVLCEKPLSESLPECLSMVAAAEHTGGLLMVSQSRRYFNHLVAVRARLAEFGPPMLLDCHYSMAPHLPGFRAVMPYPLLVDMAIHHFDLARDLTGSEPVAVCCDSANPPWSGFEGDATSAAIFRFANGARFSYTGSWCSAGFETSWNGTWRLASQGGTVLWDGDHAPTAQAVDGTVVPSEPAIGPEEIAGSLAEFVAAVRSRRAGQPIVPANEVHANVISVAMVQAAVRAAQTQRWVQIAELLDEAYAQALDSETDAELRTVLRGWGSASDHLL